MANTILHPVSTLISFQRVAGTAARHALTALTTVCLAVICIAQEQGQPPAQSNSQITTQAPAAFNSTETIPAGTRFALVLTHPIFSNTTRPGDAIHAQTTAPIIMEDHVAIPGGIFLQGTVERLKRHGTRAALQMRSVAIIFPDGSVSKIAGPVTIETDEDTALLNPSGGAKAGMVIAPMAGLGLGALIGSAAHTTQSSTLGGTTLTSSTPKGIAIGSLVGLAAGSTVALVLLAHGHQFFVDVGSPMQMTLPRPLTIVQAQVVDAVRAAQERPPIVPSPAPRPQPASFPSTPINQRTCYTPETPGTPPTVIPGIPGPNGIPGAPTIVPGTPSIPGTPYPCP